MVDIGFREQRPGINKVSYKEARGDTSHGDCATMAPCGIFKAE